MLFFLYGFFIYLASYHIFSTILLNQIGYQYLQILSISRDLIRLLIILFFIIGHYNQIIPFLKKRKKTIIMTAITISYAIIISIFLGSTIYQILIGLKYGFSFFFILLSALFIGHNLKSKHIKNIQNKLPSFIITIVIIGIVRQIFKFVYPDVFYFIGYGPIGDRVFGQNPPIYYRTGPGGRPRLQGIFAGPNNYGYFLSAFSALILLQINQIKENNVSHISSKLFNIIIYFFSILFTLSRTAILGTGLSTISLYKNSIQKNKKIRTLSIITILIIITGLSIIKPGSTQEHIIQKTSNIIASVQYPIGLGLGNSGPAIHHGGTLLPENYYLQIALDIGTIGFMLFMITLIFFLKETHSNHKQFDETTTVLFIGFMTLLFMGLFLHVFEDSMVNYLFFIPLGIFLGKKPKS